MSSPRVEEPSSAVEGIERTGLASSQNTNFAWSNCSNQNARERVFLKQQAVDDALHHGMEICSELRTAMEQEDSAGTAAADRIFSEEIRGWIEEIEKLNKANHALEILVGLAGDTVSYNNNEDPETPFRAEVVFRSYDDVAQELRGIFESLAQRNALNDQEGEDPEEEENIMHQLAEMEHSISEGCKKVQAVWGLDQEDVVKRNTAQSLLDSSTVVLHHLGTTKTICSSNLGEFAEKIKPYLDSSVMNEGFAAWPLVTEAKLFIKVDFLEHGIVLVDLPGLSDAVESRAKVAEKFYQRLEVTTIVTPARRAIDGKTGVQLMDEYHTLRMELDGKYHKKRFCVVVSQIDKIDCDVFRKDSVTAKKDAGLQRDSRQIQALTGRLATLEAQLRNEQSRALDNVTALKPRGRGSTQLKKGEHLYNQLERDTFRVQAKSKTDHVKNPKTEKADCDRELAMLLARQKWTCIQVNCASITKAIKRSFAIRQKRLASEKGTNPLYDGSVEVFPVSATAFRDHLKGRKSVGSPSVNYTGIPRLRQWLATIALEKREEHLNVILNSLERLLVEIQRWTRPKDLATYFPRKTVEDSLHGIHARYTQLLEVGLSRSYLKVKSMNPLEKAGPDQCRKVAGKAATRWAIQNSQDKASSALMSWVTFQAVLERNGGPYRSKGRGAYQYNFPEALAAAILDMAVERWHSIFHVKIPGTEKPIVNAVSKVWETYIDNLTRVQLTAPGIMPQFKECLEAIRSLQKELRDRIHATLQALSKCASEVHPEFLDSLRSQLTPIFKKSLEITGKGHYVARRAQLNVEVKHSCEHMCQNGYAKMISKYQSHLEELPRRFEDHLAFAVTKAQNHITSLFDSLATVEDKDSDVPEVLENKRNFQGHLKKSVMGWHHNWCSPNERPRFIEAEDAEVPAAYVEEADDQNDDAIRVGNGYTEGTADMMDEDSN
ncbi:hypothetical protein B0T25DRAFT_569990 [Lasiosphaeria hispida]|uniref:Uncharacterized protein n=1 Tax=Lasiosphaeria hispida TaxID=260671 RepID=A0AAJ0HEF3_9PEZI|nr:hypothetical protein B0T25DRAFT_569990 [Lasiosphaeria hispida]